MKKYFTALGLCLLGTTAQANETPCLISAQEDIPLGSPVVGVISNLAVKRGAFVKKGQIIARIADEVERRTIDLASLESGRDDEVAAAEEKFALAEREAKRLKQLFSGNLVSRQELDKALTEARVAEYQLEGAKADTKAAKLELKLAKAKLELRKLRSPIDGIVTDVYLAEGQRVNYESVVRIMQIDPLKVELVLPSEKFGQIKAGQEMMITPALNGVKDQLATVTIVDQVLDAASDTFRVQLELPNPDQAIPAGARCTVDLPGASN